MNCLYYFWIIILQMNPSSRAAVVEQSSLHGNTTGLRIIDQLPFSRPPQHFKLLLKIISKL